MFVLFACLLFVSPLLLPGPLQIDIPGVSLEAFLAFLEYLYTDHAPIEEGDSLGILELSNLYVMPRLMSMCELYVSKEVERQTAVSIAEAEVDVIGKVDG